jgi:hypothetical protein
VALRGRRREDGGAVFERAHRLYEQERGKPEGSPRLDVYISRLVDCRLVPTVESALLAFRYDINETRIILLLGQILDENASAECRGGSQKITLAKETSGT